MKYILVVFLLCFYSIHINAQATVQDSVGLLFNRTTNIQEKISLLKELNSARKESKDFKKYALLGNNLVKQSEIYLSKNTKDSDTADALYFYSYQILISSYCQLTMSYSALSAADSLLMRTDKSGDLYSRALNLKGEVFYYFDRLGESLDCFVKAFEKMTVGEEDGLKIRIYNNILSSIYLNDSLPDKNKMAGTYLRKYEQIAYDKLRKEDRENYIESYIYRSLYSYNKGDPKRSKSLLHKGLLLCEQNKTSNKYHFHEELSRVCLIMNQKDSALIYAQKALQDATKNKNLSLELKAHKTLYKLYKGSDASLALKHLREYVQVIDSLEKSSTVNKNNQEELKAVQQKEAELKRQLTFQKERSEKDLHIASLRNYYISLLLLISFICILFIYLFLKFRWERLRKESEKASETLENSEEELKTVVEKLSNTINTLKFLKKKIKTAGSQGALTKEEMEAEFIGSIDSMLGTEIDHENFQLKLKDVQEEFFKRLIEKHQKLSEKDVRLCALIKAGFSSGQISEMLSLGENTIFVKRSRLRKKLGLEKGEKLAVYLKSI